MPDEKMRLPCVRWGGHEISRLLIGHNPLKGQSHYSRALDEEMAEWYDPELGHDLDMLARCEECGINTAQFGAPAMHSVLTRYRRSGGNLQWIATFYSKQLILSLAGFGKTFRKMEFLPADERVSVTFTLNADQIRFILSYAEGRLRGSGGATRPRQPRDEW